MVISRFETSPRKSSGFAWWRMLTWLLLLLAGFGGVQYIHHAQQIWGVLQNVPADDTASASALHGMLRWDLVYLGAALVVIIACAGCILRQAWARSVLRVIALLLCVWVAYRGALLWHQWDALGQLNGTAITSLTDLKRVLRISLALHTVAVPVLLWLAWQLGQPAVRLQFRPRAG
ncbi:hypothetical protein DWU98_19630 [Dyella monticola]|uniref:Uncharacterized protein n=1 Tax=Dyella monticola TaxID=1927958 RepID=A0A370WSU5_9GAMM|nr:hypothetical protein [Dyella monticola]RDS79087.1 hypothetical protein DWU98_19630 [Dyella monticola]